MCPEAKPFAPDTTWSLGDPPDGSSNASLPTQVSPSPSPASPHSALHTTLDPFPTRHPGPAPARQSARPAGRWCRSALTARARPPPAYSAQAGVESRPQGREGSWAGPPRARRPALTSLRRLACPGPRAGQLHPSRGHPTAAPSLAPAVASRLLRSLALAPNRPQQRPSQPPPRPLGRRPNAPNHRPPGPCRLANRRSRLELDPIVGSVGNRVDSARPLKAPGVCSSSPSSSTTFDGSGGEGSVMTLSGGARLRAPSWVLLAGVVKGSGEKSGKLRHTTPRGQGRGY